MVLSGKMEWAVVELAHTRKRCAEPGGDGPDALQHASGCVQRGAWNTPDADDELEVNCFSPESHAKPA
jgi:hypothetical protein